MIVQLYDQPAQSSKVAYYMCGQCVATTCITELTSMLILSMLITFYYTVYTCMTSLKFPQFAAVL